MIEVGQPVKSSDFINKAQANANPTLDVGRVAKLEDFGKLHPDFIPNGYVATVGQDFLARDVGYISNATEGDIQTDVQTPFGQSANNSDFAATRSLTTQMAQTFNIPAAPVVPGLSFHRTEITSVKVRGRRRSGDDTNARLGASIKALDVNGHPTGADLSSFNGVFVDFSDTTGTITFATPASVDDDADYALIFKFFNSGGSTATDVLFRYQNTDVDAGGIRLTTSDSGATWVEEAGHDCFYEVSYRYVYRRTIGTVYKASANATSIERTAIVGFSDLALANGDEGIFVTHGVVEGFSGLTPGATYYLSDTAGLISTTPGTNSVKVGRALTATLLLIEF